MLLELVLLMFAFYIIIMYKKIEKMSSLESNV